VLFWNRGPPADNLVLPQDGFVDLGPIARQNLLLEIPISSPMPDMDPPDGCLILAKARVRSWCSRAVGVGALGDTMGENLTCCQGKHDCRR